MNQDAQLLRRYLEDHSEEAFAELVGRHIQLVYFSALRRLGGDAHLADDVTQRVFTALATKAASLKNHPSLTGWLYTSTRFAAAQLVRSERRRKTHEQEALTMQDINQNQESQPDPKALRPLLDEALDELSEREREVVLLRYFENRPFAEVGAHFALTPDAARMRVDRALEKLRAILSRKGILSTSIALATTLSTEAAMTAPTGLVQKTVAAALSPAVPAGSATVALWKIIAGVTAVSLGVGTISLNVLHFSEQAPAEPQVTSTQPAASLVSQDRSETELSPAGNTANTTPPPTPPTRRRTTNDFGWPRVGLFAAEAGGKPSHTVAEFRAKMKSDPAFSEVVVAQAKENLDQFYGRLFRSLQLTPAQLDVFKNLLVEKQRLHLEVADTLDSPDLPASQRHRPVRAANVLSQQALDAEIQAALGDTAYTSYLQYRESLVQWTVIEAVTEKLRESASPPLTNEQTNQLRALLDESLVKIPAPYTFDLAYGAGVFPPRIGAGLSPRVLRRAREFLSPPQIEALRQLHRPNTGTSPQRPP